MDSNPNSDSDHSDSPWPDLTLDLLLKIQSFLDSRIDRLRFRSVCKSWRLSTPKPSPSPNPYLIHFPIPPQERSSGHPHLILSQSEIYHLFDPSRRSFVSSVVAVEEGKNGKRMAWHPISGKKLGECPKVLDLSNVGVVQVGKLFHLKCGWCRNGSKYGCMKCGDCRRVVVSLRNDDDGSVAEKKLVFGGRLSILERFSDVCVVGIFGEKLMCYRFHKDKQWMVITHGGPRFPYTDVIYRKGRFYAVDEARRLVIVDNLMKVEVVNSPDVLSAGLMRNSDTSYLVNCDGELHLVVLYYGEEDDIRDPFNKKFLIYRFLESEKDWVRVSSLGEWAIFVSQCGSFSVRVLDGSLCKKNCIYFQMDIHTECSSLENDDVCFTSVFDVAKGSCDDFATDFNSPGSVISWNLWYANLSSPDSKKLNNHSVAKE